MIVIPAIDLREGRCVRLRQGRSDRETVFSEDPVAVARGWKDLGAERLHVVDLDGTVLRSYNLLRSGESAGLQYPLLSLDTDGTLYAAWTTQRHGVYL